MKVVDIALKDMLRSFRSAFALVFMFVLPIMMAAIFLFCLWRPDRRRRNLSLFPATRVALVNLDERRQTLRSASNWRRTASKREASTTS